MARRGFAGGVSAILVIEARCARLPGIAFAANGLAILSTRSPRETAFRPTGGIAVISSPYLLGSCGVISSTTPERPIFLGEKIP